MPSNAPQLNVPGALAQARELYRQGRLADAERVYAAILAVRPDQFDALQSLGTIKRLNGRFSEALDLISRAMHAKAPSPQVLWNHGVVLSALNRPREAIESFDRAIKLKSKFSEAHNDRGGALMQLHRFDEALASYDRALAAQPNFVEALYNRGSALEQLQRFDEALASYDRALALRPDFVEALYTRGNVLMQLKRFDEALGSYDRALALRPTFFEALYNRGNLLRELKRFDEAVASYDRALAVRPNAVEALQNRGHALEQLRRFEEALTSYDRALALRPNFVEALQNRGHVLRRLKRFQEALANYDRALALWPEYAEVLSNRGLIFHELKRFGEALASYDRALALRPNFVEARYNRGITLTELKRFDEALANHDRVLAERPDFVEALQHQGHTLEQLKRFDEALASYGRAIAEQPDYADAHFDEALCRLMIGDFDRGWEKYEWRWETEAQRHARRGFTQPLWLGQEEVAGKTILLHAEQGFGDTIQFCRYLPLVVARGARVVLEVQKPLQELMSSLGGHIISRGDPLPDFDLQCPLLSLPLAFRTRLETIPSAVPYLRPSPQALNSWERRLGPTDRPRIGLVWSGNPARRQDHIRSIGFNSFLSLLDINATFVSLQKDVGTADAMALNGRRDLLHFGDELRTFSDTAAIVSNLDLVITVDTSVAHLAGALGKPVWVLLSFVGDWRYLRDREDSPWYPTARLFRQDSTRAWDNVIARVHAALHDFVESRP
jgi:tetratricopeptide (TPR) repeat protein